VSFILSLQRHVIAGCFPPSFAQSSHVAHLITDQKRLSDYALLLETRKVGTDLQQSDVERLGTGCGSVMCTLGSSSSKACCWPQCCRCVDMSNIRANLRTDSRDRQLSGLLAWTPVLHAHSGAPGLIISSRLCRRLKHQHCVLTIETEMAATAGTYVLGMPYVIIQYIACHCKACICHCWAALVHCRVLRCE
jgi:hypothetical protein